MVSSWISMSCHSHMATSKRIRHSKLFSNSSSARVHVCVCVRALACACRCAFVCVRACVCVHVRVRASVRERSCLYVCLHGCMCITSGLKRPSIYLSPCHSFHKSLYHKSLFLKPQLRLNTGSCIQQGDLFYSTGLHGNRC